MARKPAPEHHGDLVRFCHFGQPRDLVPEELLFRQLDRSRPGLERVAAAVRRRDRPAAWSAWVAHFRKRPGLRWLIEPEAYARTMAQSFHLQVGPARRVFLDGGRVGRPGRDGMVELRLAARTRYHLRSPG